MPQGATNWMDAIPAAQPTMAMLMGRAGGIPSGAAPSSANANAANPAPSAPQSSQQSASWMDQIPAAQPTMAMQLATAPQQQAAPGSTKGFWHGVAGGAAQGANALVNAPFDAANWLADNLGKTAQGDALNYSNLTPDQAASIGSSPVAQGVANAVHTATAGPQVLQQASQAAAQSPAGQFLGAQPEGMAANIGAGIGSMLPFAAAQLVPGAGEVEDAGMLARLGKTAKTAAALVPTGAASGAGAYAGEQADPNNPQLGGFIGSLAGGFAPAVGAMAMAKPAEAALNLVKPFTKSGQMQNAGEALRAAATNPDAAAARLDQAVQADQEAAQHEAMLANPNAAPADQQAAQQRLNELAPLRTQIVAGSQPTTFQLTGDSGLGNLERVAAKNNPDAFLNRAGQQNAARVAQIGAQAPAAAAPEDVGAFFKQQLADLDARQTAEDAVQRGQVRGAVQPLGGEPLLGPGGTQTALQQYGADMRGTLTGAQANAKSAMGNLWKAVDPENTLSIDMTPIRQAAKQIASEMPRNAAPMQGDESAIFGAAQMLPKVQPFQELGALRSRITDAMRNELAQNGSSQSYRRMTQLLGSVDDAMASSVADKADQEAQAVAMGQMQPQDTITAQAARSAHGPFGPVYNQFQGDPQGAIQHLMQQQTGEVPGALYHPDVGPIDLVWGKAGTTKGDGYGLAKIAQHHPEALDNLQDTISAMNVRSQSANRINLESPDHRAGVRLDWDGVAKKWLMTAFKKNAEGTGTTTDTAGAEGLGDTARQSTPGDDSLEAAERKYYQNMAQSAKEWYARKNAANLAKESETGGYFGSSPQGLPERGSSPLSGVSGAKSAARGGSANSSGSQGLLGAPGDEESLTPNFDAAAQARYQAAREGTAKYHQTYTDKTTAPGVAQALEEGSRRGEFKQPESAVPGLMLGPGKGAAERVAAFQKAGGTPDQIKHYLAFSMRTAAEKEDGTLDANKLSRWLGQNREALDASGLRPQFETAAKAQQTYEEAAAARQGERKAYEKSAAGKFLGDGDPVRIMGQVLHAKDAEAVMKELAKRTAGNVAARAGLQRSVVEYILNDIRNEHLLGNATERQLKADAFQKFLRQSAPAMRHIFSPQQMKSIEDVSADIQRSQRSITGTKLPGGSNTAQDLAAGAKHTEGKHSLVGSLGLLEGLGEIGGHAGHIAGGPLGGVIGKVGGMLGAKLLQGMRDAGFEKINDLVSEAMLDPKLARALLAKVPANSFSKSVVDGAIKQMKAVSAMSAAKGIMGGYQ